MTVIKDNLVFIIMCGIPCSGKSTWVKNNLDELSKKYNAPVIVISRDIIRESLSPVREYQYVPSNESKVTHLFYRQLSHAINLKNAVVIIDNTHVKEGRIDTYFAMFKKMIDSGIVKIHIKFFDIPLWRAQVRNYIRKWKTGKWIPKDVVDNMYKNYIKLNRQKYKDYEYK